MWYDHNGRPVPEGTRILGRPVIVHVKPTNNSELNAEWKEIEALEDAGLIFIDVACRNAVKANRERVSRLQKRRRREGNKLQKDMPIIEGGV